MFAHPIINAPEVEGLIKEVHAHLKRKLSYTEKSGVISCYIITHA